MISQKDIAKQAGVERSTVSLALRDHPRIPQKTRLRIKQIARELGYRPNPLLSQIARSRWKGEPVALRETIAFIRSRSMDPVIVRAAQQRALAIGYNLAPLSAEPGSRRKRLTRVLQARGIRGIIVEQLCNFDSPLELDWEKFVLVQCGLLCRTRVLHLVGVDFLDLVNEAFERVQARGYRRIAFFLPQTVDTYSDELLLQAATGLRHTACSRAKVVSIESPRRRDGSFEIAVQRLLKIRPDAVIATEPAVAEALSLAGCVIPRKTGFASLFGNPEKASGYLDHKPLLGAAAVDLLDQKLRTNDFGAPPAPRKILITPPWCDGSTLPLRA